MLPMWLFGQAEEVACSVEYAQVFKSQEEASAYFGRDVYAELMSFFRFCKGAARNTCLSESKTVNVEQEA